MKQIFHRSVPNNAGGEEQRFTDLTQVYDNVAGRWARDEPKVDDDLIGRPFVIELIQQMPPVQTLLDLGCGDGHFCRQIGSLAAAIIGIDSSSAMLREARKRSRHHQNISYVRGDIAETLPIEPSSVDVCTGLYAQCCMESVAKLRKGFQNIRDVLKPDGTAVVQIPHPLDSFFREASKWREDVNPIDDYFHTGTLVLRNLRTLSGERLLVGRYHYTLEAYIDAINSAGLYVQNQYTPTPSPDVLTEFPDLMRECKYPYTIVFVLRRLA